MLSVATTTMASARILCSTSNSPTLTRIRASSSTPAIADDCAAFTREGGAAIQWTMGIDDLSDVTDQVRHWLDDDARDTRDEEVSVMRSAIVAS